MIAFVRGKFMYKQPDLVVVDVNGVGYALHISLNTYNDIRDLEEGSLFSYLHVREDAMMLYGFSRQEEKAMFELLISVSGVGTSTARIMLSSMLPGEIMQAIGSGNSKKLEAIKGIGRKTAERIILELRDKVSKLPQTHAVADNLSSIPYNTREQDALNALVSLGVSRSIAESAVKTAAGKLPESAGVEQLIKEALKLL
jgi:Holliday junction DNA helicase RuvA